MTDPAPGRRAYVAVLTLLFFVPGLALVPVTPGTTPVSGAAPYYPPARSGAAMAYDPIDHYVVLFSGSNGANDTWAYANGRWSLLEETTAPAPRVGACVAWDATSGSIVLFGGQEVGAGGPLLNDTWEFVHGNWTEIHPSVSPPPLVWASCAFDADDGLLVMFGGTSSENATTSATWTFADGTWTLAPVHETPRRTPGRFGAAMLYWGLGDYIDLYGGQGNTSSLNDSWEWILGQWQEINSGEPPTGRVLASVAYDGTDEYGTLFGGATSFNGTATASTWTLGANGRWASARTTSSPSARVAGAFAFDARDGYFVLFGGAGAATGLSYSYNDTWTYSVGNWTNITASADRPLPPAPSGAPAPSDVFEIELLIGAAVAVAVGVLLVLARRRGSRGSANDRPDRPTDPPSGPPSS